MRKIGSIQFQQVPHQGNDCQPLLFADCADLVPEPVPVQCNDLEHECDTLGVETIMRAWGYAIGVREPGCTEGCCAGNDDSQTICTPYNDSGADSLLFMPLCIREINKPDIAVLPRVSAPVISKKPSARCRSPFLTHRDPFGWACRGTLLLLRCRGQSVPLNRTA